MTERAEQIMMNTTHAIAAASVISPAWLPGLHEVSQLAAVLMPILGAVWLVVQIARAIAHWGR